MEKMSHPVFISLFLLKLFYDVSSDAVSTVMVNTHNTEIPAPEIIKDYPPCSWPSRSSKCLVACSVSNVTQAQLSWFNRSQLYSSLMISDLNKILYLVVENNEKNNYSCVVSTSGGSNSSYLNISTVCPFCLVNMITNMSVTEGESVTLSTYLTELKDGDDIMWFHEHTFISEVYKSRITYHDCMDGQFGNKLQLDSKTGSLTITNLTKLHSGVYKLKSPTASLVDHQQHVCQGYNVTVYDSLPVPVITNDTTQCSSLSKCVLLCSVNMSHVSLSWYKGSSLLSSISVSDVNIRLSLPLEVDYEDTNNYSCVVNNSFTNETTQLNVSDLCKEHSQQDNSPHTILLAVGISVCVGVLLALIWGCRKGVQDRITSFTHSRYQTFEH